MRGGIRVLGPGLVAPVVLAALLTTLLAGCGGSALKGAPSPDPSKTAAADESTLPPPVPSPAKTPTPTGDGSLVPSALPTPASPSARRPTRVPAPLARIFGADMSWPQCPKGMGIPEKRSEGAPLPTAAARFVVLGLTNGPSFHPNPCLADQLAWARARHLWVAAYSILSYPDAATLAQVRDKGPYDGRTTMGGLRNAGYQAALFNVATMRRVGLRTPVVWVDVEPVTHFEWSDDTTANAAVVAGAVRGYTDAGYRIGYYSIAGLWSRVVGNLRTDGAPEWRPAGARGLGEALRRCGDDWSFGGGRAVLGQWVEDHRDRDVICPGVVRDLGAWFHRS